MTTYLAALKLAHLLGAGVLFGTGLGIAFFMFRADRSGDVATIAATAKTVVLADFLFTATAVILQPITGILLAWEVGYMLTEGWILLSVGLYVLTGLCWLPVVVLQMRMRDAALNAMLTGQPLPPEYYKAARIWFWLGWPAFLSVMGIFWLMITKPDLALFP